MVKKTSHILTKKKKSKAFNLLKSGRLANAEEVFLKLIEKNNSDKEVWEGLAATQRKLRKLGNATQTYARYIDSFPEEANAYFGLGQLLQMQGDVQGATKNLEIAARLNPKSYEILFHLASVYYETNMLKDAEAEYKKVLKIKPSYLHALNNLAIILSSKGEYGEAIELLDKAEGKINSSHVDKNTAISIYCNLGISYTGLGKLDEALFAYECANKLNPEHIGAIVGKANMLERDNRPDEAYNLILPFLDKGVCDVSLALVFSRVCGIADRCEDAIELLKHIVKMMKIPLKERYVISLSIGKLYEKLKKYDKSFSFYKQANDLISGNYSLESDISFMNSLTEAYTAESIKSMPRPKQQTDRVIFILGMPRSGTSLVEQILASHPDVYGGGEQVYIHRSSRLLSEFLNTDIKYPECISLLDEENIEKLAGQYNDYLSGLSPDVLRITDKLPHNFLNIGFINFIAPDARIIHCVRNPYDICLSCYTNDFAGVHGYMHDLENLGNYYNAYEELINYWKEVCGLKWLDVEYEQLIADPETNIRSIVEFSGLEWDERCLSFHETKRFVATTSYNQVNKPIYKDSVNRWEKFGDNLQPLIDVIKCKEIN